MPEEGGEMPEAGAMLPDVAFPSLVVGSVRSQRSPSTKRRATAKQ